MKSRLTAAIAALAIASFAGSAQADVVAGWDFSQFFGDGALTIDSSFNPANTLDANYSNFDPTNNAGIESADFGVLYFDGSFGSTAVTVDLSGTEDFVPTAAAGGSLASNLDAPVQGFGDNPFESFSILSSEGQEFTQQLSMTAQESVQIVFAADLGAAGARSNWQLSFGGTTFSDTSNVNVEFSTDGSSYSSVGNVQLDTNDTPYVVDLDPGPLTTGFVRLTLDPSVGQPIIDNVAIAVPEPGALASGVAVLAALGFLRRGRRSES